MSEEFWDAVEHLSELENWTYREKLQLRMGILIGGLLAFCIGAIVQFISFYIQWLLSK